MFVQNACTRGNNVAMAAFVWFFSSVRFQMGPQNACMWGCISQKAAPRLLQGRATSFKTLWSSISSILYLLITTSLQFGVAHGQALLYVSYHQVLQGKGSHLQNVVLLHLLHLHHHLTPVSCCTWSGSALCRPPPNPPHESELQTLPLSLSILSFFGLWKNFIGGEMCHFGGWSCAL